MAASNHMNFRKKIKMAFKPPIPHFQKILLQFFYNGYGPMYARWFEDQIVWNACT